MSLRTKGWEIVLELTCFIALRICTLDEFTSAIFLVYTTTSLINYQRLYIRTRVEKQLYVHVVLPHLVSVLRIMKTLSVLTIPCVEIQSPEQGILLARQNRLSVLKIRADLSHAGAQSGSGKWPAGKLGRPDIWWVTCTITATWTRTRAYGFDVTSEQEIEIMSKYFLPLSHPLSSISPTSLEELLLLIQLEVVQHFLFDKLILLRRSLYKSVLLQHNQRQPHHRINQLVEV